MFSFFTKRHFFSDEEEKRIMDAIREAELESSGEIRLFVESNCPKDIRARTLEMFKRLKMYRTRERNGVLIYIAMDDHRYAIFGDEGIHAKMGFEFWTSEVADLKKYFLENQIVTGICQVVLDIGQALKKHFPYPPDDKNELPNKPVYGR
jgi:uncharacterized membrane protein